MVDSKTVRFVFRVLIGTVIAIVLTMFTIEYINLSMTQYTVRSTIELSLYNACNSFNQESYRSSSLGELEDESGNQYQSGNVYGLRNNEDIYEHFYGKTQKQTFGQTAQYTGSPVGEYYNYLSKPIMNMYSTDENNSTAVTIGNSYTELGYIKTAYDYISGHGGALDAGSSEYSKLVNGLTAISAQYTPSNVNAIYLGLCDGNNGPAYTAVNNLFKWNLASMWSNCSNEMRHGASYVDRDGNVAGEKYAERSGWRIYTDTAKITAIDYYIYDISAAGGKNALKKVTNIENYGNESHSGANSDNKYVMAARVSYSVDAEYTGITPMAKILNYAASIGNTNIDTSNGLNLGTGDTGLDITREGHAVNRIRTTISSDGANGVKYYVWYYNIT
jgi:hypothetical protein